MPARKPSLRALPSVDAVLQSPPVAAALERLPRSLVVEAVRARIAAAREALRNGGKAMSIQEIAESAALAAEAGARPGLRRVLNATGIVLHTNLGRAPLPESARRAIENVARGYSNLEFDLATGKRGERGTSAERWLTRLTGAEAALVVNNGAGAILLALSALASGKHVIVSRGELVEIGGSFRVPEVMEKSGARLLEVGATNRTHLRDYERALEKHGAAVGAILRVHRSNFRIEGFTAQPPLADLARLARRAKVPLIEDLGSGAFVDPAAFGLDHEPTVKESLSAGCDIVTFSGDKLLGAAQAGLIVGRRTYVQRARKDPFARALRMDKLALAALEASLAAYADPVRAQDEIPALAMLRANPDDLERRAHRLAEALRARLPGLNAGVERGDGEVGGGAMPLTRLPGWVVTLDHAGRTVDELDRWARSAEPPVVGYIRAGKFRLDVRTLTDAEAMEAADALARAHL